MDSYLSLVPRGLQHTARDVILAELGGRHQVMVDFVGEPMSQDEEERRIGELSDILTRLQQKKESKKSSQAVKSCWFLPVGSVHEEDRKVHTSLGYLNRQQPVWAQAGLLGGLVWVKIVTNAPVQKMTNLRCIGPLLALINVCENIGFSTAHTLEEATAYTEDLFSRNKQNYQFTAALHLWHQHAQKAWNLSVQGKKDLDDKVAGKSVLKYRLSSMRSESEMFQYSRKQWLAKIADSVVPQNELPGPWKVDLCRFDLEVLLLVHTHSLAVGLSLRPYQMLGTQSFAKGHLPRDITPPYLPDLKTEGWIRLRPTTAQLLLSLARIEPGDVVLDPCAGMGTIPIEVALSDHVPAVGLGGDIVLTHRSAGPAASRYTKEAHEYKSTCRQHVSMDTDWHETMPKHANCADLVGWDAAYLPVREASIDVVVSDLPFGQQCLSANKLTGVLPLMLSEMARVLRKGTGRMVLLCGNFVQVLQAMQEVNESNKGDAFVLPCDGIFPVNIGGLLPWCVCVTRGTAPVSHLGKHTDRVRKMTKKRERIAQLQTNDRAGKKRTLQT